MNSNTSPRKNPVSRNEPFICQKCATPNKKAEGTCRNHCHVCLFSLHVDATLPGDRQSLCHGLMEPIATRHSGNKGCQILHECLSCHEKKWNIALSDDNPDLLIHITQRGNMDSPYLQHEKAHRNNRHP